MARFANFPRLATKIKQKGLRIKLLLYSNIEKYLCNYLPWKINLGLAHKSHIGDRLNHKWALPCNLGTISHVQQVSCQKRPR